MLVSGRVYIRYARLKPQYAPMTYKAISKQSWGHLDSSCYLVGGFNLSEKIWVKLDHFPIPQPGVKRKNVWNHQLDM